MKTNSFGLEASYETGFSVEASLGLVISCSAFLLVTEMEKSPCWLKDEGLPICVPQPRPTLCL